MEIIEVGPRDGLQNESVLVSTEDKVALIERSIAAGLRRIEATSFVHPGRVPQMADAEAVMAAVPRSADVSYIGLVLNRRGFDRAVAAGVDEVNFVVVASETFSQRNQGMSVAASVENVRGLAADARAAGLRLSVTLATAFGCPFEGRIDPGRVVEHAGRMAAAGADEVMLADTIGAGVPAQVRRLVPEAQRAAGGVPVGLHLHNTRNTGYANAYAGLEQGVTLFDASVGGLGGCPFAPRATGNIATEDLVYLLAGEGVETGVDLDALIGVAAWLGGVLGRELPGLVQRAGGFPQAA